MYIRTLSELLTQMRESNKEALGREPAASARHSGTIGDMYEGITAKLLNAALFTPFNLRVAKGHIRLPDGAQTPQLDCMLAVGPGLEFPGTQLRIYDLEQVVAIVETTKTLDRGKLAEDLGKFTAVNQAKPSARMRSETVRAHARIHHEAYRVIFGEPMPRFESLKRCPEYKQFVAHALLADATSPLRIIWAYEGYTTEVGLRNAFADWAQQAGLSELVQMPNLILCGDLSIVKANAMPFMPFARTDADWDICYSQARHAVRNFVNILWHRLTRLYDLQFALLADGKVYRENPLLSLCVSDDAKVEVTSWGAKKGELVAPDEVLVPANSISLEEFVVITLLSEQAGHSGLELQDEKVTRLILAQCDAQIELAKTTGLPAGLRIQWSNVQELAHELTRSKLLVREGTVVRLNTIRCAAWWNEDGMFAGENRDGRFWDAALQSGVRAQSDNDDLPPNAEWMTPRTAERLLGFVNWQIQRIPSRPEFRVRGIHAADLGVHAVALGENLWQLEVTSGTFALIWDLFNRLLAHRETFVAIGDPVLEEMTGPSIPQLFSSGAALGQFATKPGEVFSTPVPRCAARRSLALHLVDLALNFVVGAEVARVTRGHSGYAEAVREGAVRAPTPDERKALRFDADGYAIWDVLRFGLGMLSVDGIDKLDPHHNYRSREQVAVNAALAMHGALLMDRDLNRFARVPNAERFSRVHQGMLIGFIMRKAGEGTDQPESVTQAVASAVKAMERGVGSITGTPARDESLVAGFRDGLQGSVAEAWFTICPLLKPFSCDPLADCERPST